MTKQTKYTVTDLAAAGVYAAEQHRHQKRKYSGAPYIEHPMRVMANVAAYTDDIPTMMAAVMHDVVEDCAGYDAEFHRAEAQLELLQSKLREIDTLFGTPVATIVWSVTDTSNRLEHGSRAERRALDRQHYIDAFWQQKLVKLCDLDDNASDIFEGNPGFAKKWIGEKLLLLPLLKPKEHDLICCPKLDSLWEKVNERGISIAKQLGISTN